MIVHDVVAVVDAVDAVVVKGLVPDRIRAVVDMLVRAATIMMLVAGKDLAVGMAGKAVTGKAGSIMLMIAPRSVMMISAPISGVGVGVYRKHIVSNGQDRDRVAAMKTKQINQTVSIHVALIEILNYLDIHGA